MSVTDSGLLPPATPVAASSYSATIRAAHLAGSLDRYELAVKPRGIFDQVTLQCCVSCALANAMEIRQPIWPRLAPLFHYFAARIDRGFGDSSGRMTLLEGLYTLERSGICEHALHQPLFTPAGAATRPSEHAYLDAMQRRLSRVGLFSGYEAIGSGSRAVSIRQHLRRNRPVLLGFTAPIAYPCTFLEPDHQWDDFTLPSSNDGHCVLVIGYDDMRQALRILDSRGQHNKFENGCWWMGYPVADSPVVLVAYSLI